MKRGIILLVLLIFIITPITQARTISIPELFTTNDNQISAETEGTTTNFYAGSKLVATKKDSTLKYHYRDALGSNRLDSQGNQFKSLPFGQVLISSNNRFEFTNKELDEGSNLHHFGARYYDSSIGKFLSVDPVPGELPYGYVMNNPMNLIDPLGLATEEGSLQMMIIPSADGWENINLFTIALYAETQGIAGYTDIYGERTVTNVANYFVRFNEESGGTPTTELSPGDVIYLPLTQKMDPVDLLRFTNQRAEELGIGTFAQQGNPTEDARPNEDQILSEFMEFLNDPRYGMRYETTAIDFLKDKGLTDIEAEQFLFDYSPPPHQLQGTRGEQRFRRGVYNDQAVVYDPSNQNLAKVVEVNINRYIQHRSPSGSVSRTQIREGEGWMSKLMKGVLMKDVKADTVRVHLYDLIEPYYTGWDGSSSVVDY